MKNLLWILLILPTLFFAQKKQPKIGLVLSGGGAKGLAHIGVLKEIDKAGLQIDYIGGTSMGAIVGGLYAAGYSGEQIEEIVKNTDLLQILQDELPRSALPFFEKEFGEKHAISLPVTENGIGLPRAVSKGQNVLNLFNYVLAHVDSVPKFSSLSVPFFCVATDAETGKMVLLEDGSLPMALRASGSFPTLLNPVLLNDQLLLDGGIANNFPSDIMKKKGVDIIIGVDVQSDLIKREGLNSVITILNQIVSYDIYEQSRKAIKDCDVYIKPDISEFTVVDFEKKEGIIAQGDKAGAQYRNVMDSLASLQTVKRKRPVLVPKDDEFQVKEIEVIGSQNYTPAYVKGKLNIRRGDHLTRKGLTERITYLAATDNYSKIDYRIKNDTLQLFLLEKKIESEVRLGVHYDELYQSGILATYIHKRLLINNDELSVDLILGDRIRANLNYFVDNGFYTSYGIRSRYNHFKTNTEFSFDNNPNVNQIELSYTDVTAEFFVQSVFGRKFAIGAGAEFKNLEITTETLAGQNNNKITFDNSNYVSFDAFAKLDTYDDRAFPTKGLFANVGGKWYAWSSDYLNNFEPFVQIGGRIGFATTFWDRLTFQYTNDAGFTFENPESEVFDFYVGGYNQNYINTFVPMYGYEIAQVSGKSFVRSEFLFRYRMFNKHYAVFLANYGRVDENVFINARELFRDVLSGYAIGYSLDTILGPIEVKYSWSPENDETYWLFNLGFWF
jgi:NTE family protein